MEKNTSLETMQKCAAMGDKIFAQVCVQLKKHALKTEIELADYIKNEIYKLGAKESFPVIVISGLRAGNDIHPVPTTSVMQGFVIIDFGIKLGGYCSDMTRTVYVGKPMKEEIAVYNTVLRAQIGSTSYLKAGLPVSASDAFVRGILAENRYKGRELGQYFIHTLGHGISKKVHESPKIYYKSKEIFKLGKVVTSEPGIYIPKTLGIRIEDMYLITDKEPIQLTKSKKELLVFHK